MRGRLLVYNNQRVPYAGGELRYFDFDDVESWGKLCYYGDARFYTVVKLKSPLGSNGPVEEVAVVANEQTPTESKKIHRISKAFWKKLRASGRDVMWPSRDLPFVLIYGEEKGGRDDT